MATSNAIGADAAKLAGLQIDFLQKLRNGQLTIGHVEWFLGQTKEERDKLSGVPAADKFVFVKTFDIIVPADYQHRTQLKSFKKNYAKNLHYFNDSLTDENFSKVSAQLKPGQKVTVNVYRQTASGSTSSDERITFLRALPGNKFYGAQGASLVYEEKADQLETGFAYVAMDEKDNLPLVGGHHRVPYVYRRLDGDCRFNLGDFEVDWDSDSCLLCFSDVSA